MVVIGVYKYRNVGTLCYQIAFTTSQEMVYDKYVNICYGEVMTVNYFFYKYFNKYSSNCSHQKKISKEIENVQ